MEVIQMEVIQDLTILITYARISSIRSAGKQRRKIHNSKLSKELFSYSKLRNF